ncbi:hypothetical protein H5410_023693 [Solanum commersonii]|uniref:Uncharacterized protein n=1 Tax=Solanum commersonii TaxID=4109 RepID=A0A9J5ZJU7_SOLCO|nr:hypothetical protein H5410_023693 [Solanum commersonii]
MLVGLLLCALLSATVTIVEDRPSGIPSVVDCNSQLNESLEGTDTDTSHKKLKKKTVDEV